MTAEKPGASPALSDQLGLEPERAAFERWRDIERPSLMRHSIVYSDLAELQADAIAWDAWNACWPLARAAIYSAEQAQIEAPLRARLEKAEHWAKHAMLMRRSQNEELLRILRGEA